MKTLTLYVVSVALLGFATLGLAEIVEWQPCDEADSSTSTCTVHSVSVTPCREAARSRPCRIRKGRTASISFDFTPDFSGDNLQTRAYWGDLPFLGMNTNACDSTTCPATAGTRQNFTYSLPIGTIYPTQTYDVKWKLWNAEEKECCFIFQIELKN